MTTRIAVLPGDGIGPEIVHAACRVLQAAGEQFDVALAFQEAPFGGAAIDTHGVPLPEETLALAKSSDAVFLGAAGGPKWDDQPRDNRPETGLLALRKALGLYVNLRPVRDYDFLRDRVAIKEDVVRDVDIVFCRELTGGIYFGEKKREGDFAWDRMEYHRSEIERIVRKAFTIAEMRPRRHLTSVDKANVLETSRLWREVVETTASEFPDVKVHHLYVDNAALQLVINPRQFDVIVTENSFGDILSDEGAALCGSLGMLPSASLGGNIGLFEPSHGSAPDIAGKGIANPLATILSAALLLRHACSAENAAQAVERAVYQTLAEDIKTRDIAGTESIVVGTEAMADAVIQRLA